MSRKWWNRLLNVSLFLLAEACEFWPLGFFLALVAPVWFLVITAVFVAALVVWIIAGLKPGLFAQSVEGS